MNSSPVPTRTRSKNKAYKVEEHGIFALGQGGKVHTKVHLYMVMERAFHPHSSFLDLFPMTKPEQGQATFAGHGVATWGTG